LIHVAKKAGEARATPLAKMRPAAIIIMAAGVHQNRTRNGGCGYGPYKTPPAGTLTAPYAAGATLTGTACGTDVW
jgi:hypothetical protein